jgi:hypothetical protein
MFRKRLPRLFHAGGRRFTQTRPSCVTKSNPRDFRAIYLVGRPVGLSDVLRGVAEPLGLESSARKGKAAQVLAEGLEEDRRAREGWNVSPAPGTRPSHASPDLFS